MRTEFLGRMNNLSAHDGENRFDGLDAFFRDGEIIIGECDQVSQLAGGDCAFLFTLA